MIIKVKLANIFVFQETLEKYRKDVIIDTP